MPNITTNHAITYTNLFSEKNKINDDLKICNHLIYMETVRPAKKTVKITTKYYVHPVFQIMPRQNRKK